MNFINCKILGTDPFMHRGELEVTGGKTGLMPRRQVAKQDMRPATEFGFVFLNEAKLKYI
jgi:hypothetical protein